MKQHIQERSNDMHFPSDVSNYTVRLP